MRQPQTEVEVKKLVATVRVRCGYCNGTVTEVEVRVPAQEWITRRCCGRNVLVYFHATADAAIEICP